MNRFPFPAPFPLPGLWWTTCLVLQLSLVSHAENIAEDLLAWLWLGSMWAGWAACLWWSSAIENPWGKLATVAAAAAWHAFWMSHSRDQPVLRYLIMFGGYAVAQSVFFRFCRVPAWSWATRRLRPIGDGRRQFSIFEWLVLTTATALLITGAKRYEPLVGDIFWAGLPVVCLSLASTATLCSLAFVAPTRQRRRLFAYGSLGMVFIGSMATAWLELKPAHSVDFMDVWPAYYGIQSVFAVLIATFAACGRMFANAHPSPAEAVIKTPDPLNLDADESPASSDLLPFRRPPHK
ncbi:MAG: hypothetical protein ACO1RT_13415 [Planctomycetaceae bacterium]